MFTNVWRISCSAKKIPAISFSILETVFENLRKTSLIVAAGRRDFFFVLNMFMIKSGQCWEASASTMHFSFESGFQESAAKVSFCDLVIIFSRKNCQGTSREPNSDDIWLRRSTKRELSNATKGPIYTPRECPGKQVWDLQLIINGNKFDMWMWRKTVMVFMW